jgi:prepilin signal peptidase PulO-like enzyme (type II secretory pathway)
MAVFFLKANLNLTIFLILLTIGILMPIFHWQITSWASISTYSITIPRSLVVAYGAMVIALLLFTAITIPMSLPELVLWAIFVGCALALALIDGFTGYLPNSLTYPLMFFGVLANLLGDQFIHFQYFFDPLQSLIGLIAGYLFLFSTNYLHRLFAGEDGLGMGDAKLAGAFGSWFGPIGLAYILGIASAISLIVPIFSRLTRKTSSKFQPFGPYLVLAAVSFPFALHYFIPKGFF